MASLSSPASSASGDSVGLGVRAVILAPTKELAHQIHNECLKLAQGRKWRTILFSKATASTLADKAVRDKVGRSSVPYLPWRKCSHRIQTSS
jgi:ATP-dependent RNA helicase DDX52/ROK1